MLLRIFGRDARGADLAAACKQLYQVERGMRDNEGRLKLRPVSHRETDQSTLASAWLGFSSSDLCSNATGESWRCVRKELERMHLVTLEASEGRVARRSRTTTGQHRFFAALELPEPPAFSDFEVAARSD